ncbi:MAG TPA: VanZ family protein [Aggregatilineaceae bacterium]|nr:VanZ family protein [Aggregatilineaceae bacterium]
MRWITHSPALGWLAVLGWLALVGFLMLAPGEGSLVEDTSRAFGGTDLTDALGHVVLFGVLAALLAHALSFHLPPDRALWLAAAVAITVGTALELAQLLAIERGASLLDLAANWLGPLAAATWLRRTGFSARAMPRSGARESQR